VKVTIITPTYNSAETVVDTLVSVANQSYPMIEHIIVDGFSDDDTLEKVKEFKHISKIISEKDEGIFDAMNKGLDNANGEIIGILNSDDIFSSNEVIQMVVNAFQKTNSDALYANLVYTKRNNTDKVVRKWVSGSYNRFNFYNGWMPPHPTFFVKKSIYDKFGKFDLAFKNAADYELMLRFLFKEKIKTTYLPIELVRMRVGGASNASFLSRIMSNRMDALAWKKNGLTPKWYTFIRKPISKIKQYF